MTVFNIPNSMTMLRIVTIPVFVTSIIYAKFDYALGIFVFAAVTDLLDGAIARLTNQKTALGTLLDPLADKALLVTSCVIFTYYGWVPKWYAIVVISRDLIVVIGWVLLYLIAHTHRVEPLMAGKVSIALQLVVLAYILLQMNFPMLPVIPVAALLLVAMITAASGLQYIANGLRQHSA